MLVDKTSIKNIFVVRMNPGDDILEALGEAVKKNNIKNALILFGFGSARSYHYHVVTTRENPPENAFSKEDKASDIITVNGYVINGRIHAHIGLSDKDKAYGGHLESGTQVLTFLNIVMAEVDYEFSDEFDSIGSIEELQRR